MRMKPALVVLALMVSLTACERGREEPATSVDEPAEGDLALGDEEPVSILRPDIEQPEAEEIVKPLNITIGFPEGGADLNAEAVVALKEVIASKQVEGGLPILLGAHSDAAGSDAVNARASEARGLAVAEWLIKNGIADSRIRVIVFGEQNPAKPNALPNGAPNEAGRAVNRRVEITVDPNPGALSTNDLKVEETD